MDKQRDDPSESKGGQPTGLVRNLLEAFPSPVVVFDPETLAPIEFNDNAASMMGYSREEFALLTIADLEAAPAPRETARHVQAIHREGVDTFVRLHKRKDGKRIRVLISVRWTDWFGKPGMMTTWHDASELPAKQDSMPRPVSQESADRTYEEFVWADPRTGELLELVDRVANTDTTVLITGETGTGKERIARRIHQGSQRADGPFVAVNCAALPGELVESELFGHVRGAFSGASAARVGSFEQAAGGTLFLDEIGELPPVIQPKLLRVLEDCKIQPVGATETRTIDVRILAATNRMLGQSSQESSFRSDLFHRVNGFPVHIPPLRERSKDIHVLVEHVLQQLEIQVGNPIGSVEPDDMVSLLEYSWPGNVRELQNVLRRAAILSKPGEIRLPRDWRVVLQPGGLELESGENLDSWMRQHIVKTMQACQWNLEGRGGAAERLGLAPSTLRYRLQKLGITRPT